MEKHNQNGSDADDDEKSHGILNILKLIFLVAVLAGAWFILDWLINGK